MDTNSFIAICKLASFLKYVMKIYSIWLVLDSGYDFTLKEHEKSSDTSGKDYDNVFETSAKTLKNVNLKAVYIGASPNIYINFSFFFKLMKKMRIFLGHLIHSFFN